MVQDRTVSLGCFVAYMLWTLALALMIGGTLFHTYTLQNWGIVCAAAGATATVRSYFVSQNRMMRNAFQLGRDSAAIPIHRER